jgi:hypothetical protein
MSSEHERRDRARQVHPKKAKPPRQSTVISAMGHERRIGANAPAAGRSQTADPAGGQGGFRLGPATDSRAAQTVGPHRPPSFSALVKRICSLPRRTAAAPAQCR